MVDLHALTRKHGTAFVADVIGCSERALEDMRRGYTAVTLDDLFVLLQAFPDFDLVGTIRRIGTERERKGRSRKARA